VVRKNRKSQGKCVLACMEFGQLVLRKIIEIIATRCQILSLKCTKFDFSWGSTPDPAGELTVLPTPWGDLLLWEGRGRIVNYSIGVH